MYDIGYDLVIHEEGVEQTAATIKEKLVLHDTWLTNMLFTLEDAKKEAIIEGAVAQNLDQLVHELYRYILETNEMGEKVELLMTEYLAEMAEADKEFSMIADE